MLFFGKNKKIQVKDTEVSIKTKDGQDYISLTDNPAKIIKHIGPNNIKRKKISLYFLSIILCICLSVGVIFICSSDHQNIYALEIDDFKTAYDFKGITLGITLEEFRARPHPDKMENSRILCVRDKEVLSDLGKQFLFTLDEAEIALQANQCIWVTESIFIKGRLEPSSLSLANSGYASYKYHFTFIPDNADGKFRLYKIDAISNNAAFENVLNGISQKFGTPLISHNEIQNRFGAKFDQITALWENKSSKIIIENLYNDVKTMKIILIDINLDSIYKMKKQEIDSLQKNDI